VKPLPQYDHTVSRPAGLWLAGYALLLLPLDAALYWYGYFHPDVLVLETYMEGNYQVTRTQNWLPVRIELLRLAIPLASLVSLVLSGCIQRVDAGLTVGKPKVTLFWLVAPVAVAAAAGLLLIPAGILLLRWQQWPLPDVVTRTISLYRMEHLWLNILHWCILTPLFEEVLYRGVLVPGLEGLGGRRLALLGSGVAWACLHVLVYTWPRWTSVFYFFAGMLGAWIFLKSRSLLVLIPLHALNNLMKPVLNDVLILQYPDLIPNLLGYPSP
jgi:membrane protease YdiL (CAAX protease family)